ncbi:putative guanosine-diphosphatase [Erysiphe neolycopersici]|uniref:guanosine-diphosphatase n=1 Tax=Erysiphe neolycopersici TaxID=212602 RepID=A0A420HDU0_9PEZI|nr:putative guanosine-diphosphatase [Erysiphe neolycopersici]
MKRTSTSHQAKNRANDFREKSAWPQNKIVERNLAESSTRRNIGWMTQSQRSRYIKTGSVLFLVVFLVYYLLRGEQSYHEVKKINFGQTSIDELPSTTKCTKSFYESKPLIQYVLMIDAGSTGSRIHIYKFNNCGPTPELEHEEFKMTEKRPGGSGLSSYKTNAEEAAKSLDILMDVAMKTVPDELKLCTPVAVKATAGLRLLGPEISQAILVAVRSRLESTYPFPVVSDEKNGVAIMDGKDEGVYAWITTNYLLGKIGGIDKSNTAAVLDLGGGSTQIVFEPTFKRGQIERLVDGDHKYSLTFGNRDFELYQHSHLGYGLMSARESIHRTLIQDIYKSNSSDDKWISQPIVNPCITPGLNRQIEVKLDPNHKLGEKVSVNMVGPSSPAPAQCRRLAEKILYKHADCVVTPCSFNGIYQPSLSTSFSTEDIYTFSYFYDRINPLGMPESFTLHELLDLTTQVCSGESQWGIFASVPGALEELRGRPEHCLDLSFIVALLHTGYEMPIDREIKIAKKINNNELGWCLGASLPLLNTGSGWQCRIKEIS